MYSTKHFSIFRAYWDLEMCCKIISLHVKSYHLTLISFREEAEEKNDNAEIKEHLR